MENSCNYISDLMIDYINKKLTDTEKVDLFSHLASCGACRKELSSLCVLKKQTTCLDVSMSSNLSEAIFKNVLNELNNTATTHKTHDTIGCDMVDRIIQSINKTPGNLVKGIISAMLYPVKVSISTIKNY